MPLLGDLIGVLASSYILAEAVRLGVGRSVLLRMALNVAVEGVVGAIPLAGDLFDAAWKSNQMNVELLRERALASGEERRRGGASDWLFLGLIVLGLLTLLAGSILLSLWLLSLLLGSVPPPARWFG